MILWFEFKKGQIFSNQYFNGINHYQMILIL